MLKGFPGGGLVVKNLPANAGNTGSILGQGRSPGEASGKNTGVDWSCERVRYDLATKQQ